MKLLIAVAFLALASATSEPEPFKLQTPTSVKVVDGPTPTIISDDSSLPIAEDATNPKNPTTIEITPVKVVDAPTDSKIADEIVPVKVVDAPSESIKVADGPIDIAQTFQIPDNTPEILDLPLDDPEAMRKLYPIHLLADFSPAFVSSDVMRQLERDSNAINFGGAHPFSFNNGEPLDSVETVIVADSPVDELDYRMDPVIVVEAPNGEQAFFAEMPNVPESVKLVDNVGFQEPVRPLPREMWRGPPMEEEQRMPAQKPADWRDAPQILYKERPVYYRDMNMLRRDAQYQMPPAAYRDPTLR